MIFNLTTYQIPSEDKEKIKDAEEKIEDLKNKALEEVTNGKDPENQNEKTEAKKHS